MSRGPGRWQELLLRLVEEYDCIPIPTMVENVAAAAGRAPTRSEYVAARRAARRLAEGGKVRAVYLTRCDTCGEIFGSWGVRCCGLVRHVLVVTRDPEIKTLLPRRLPKWIDVSVKQLEQQRDFRLRMAETMGDVSVASGELVQRQHIGMEVTP